MENEVFTRLTKIMETPKVLDQIWLVVPPMSTNLIKILSKHLSTYLLTRDILTFNYCNRG